MNNTLQQLIDHHYALKPQRFSARLGASQIGEPCERSLWYSFRHVSPASRSGQLGRICETGAWYEQRIIGWLRAIGLQVEAPEKQFEFTACSGHFVCKLDGAVLGVPEAPKTWHLLECKHCNQAKYQRVARGVEKAQPKWWAQVQVSMHLAGLERGLFVVADKNETWQKEDIYTERVRPDFMAAVLLAKAQRVIDAAEPPVRIADTEEARECSFCDHVPVCHQSAVPRRCCRTCAFVEVGTEGRWLCTVAASMRGLANRRPPSEYRDDVLPVPEAGQCEHYICLPSLDDGAGVREWMKTNGR